MGSLAERIRDIEVEALKKHVLYIYACRRIISIEHLIWDSESKKAAHTGEGVCAAREFFVSVK